jgi:hypothetical protein
MKKKFFDKPALVLAAQAASVAVGIGGGAYLDKNYPLVSEYEYLNHCSRQFETISEPRPSAYKLVGGTGGLLGYALLLCGRVKRKEQSEKGGK